MMDDSQADLMVDWMVDLKAGPTESRTGVETADLTAGSTAARMDG